MLNILLITLSMLVPGDSLRTEMINGKLHVVHQVGEKETLYGLSRRYGTTVADILTQNPTADAGLEVGQILKIPYGGKPKAPDAVKTSEGIVHRVSAKETMFSIARHYNVSVDDIKLWNNLKDGNLSIGQEILIRAFEKPQAPTSIPVIPVPSTTPTAAKTHTVAPKETLYSIARLYSMSVDQLKEWNSLTANDVKVGQVLTVAAAAPGTTVAPVTSPTSVTTTPGTSPGSITTTPGTSMATTPGSTHANAPPLTPVVVPAVTPTTTPTTTTVTTPSTTISPNYVEPVRISESVAGANEVRETVTAGLLQGSEGNRKYLAQHATILPGTILKIRNLATNQEVFVRVMGPPSTTDATVVILISKSAYDRLGSKEPTFQAEITYYK